MAEDDTSFNATGPTVVAFETVPLTESQWPAIGVGVFGSSCGVHGVGGTTTINALFVGSLEDVTRNAAPSGVGVNGIGDDEGVHGKGPTGVHGVGDGIGLLGEGPVGVQGLGVAAGALEAPGVLGIGVPGVRGTAAAAGAGVEGRGGIGVDGKGGDLGVVGNGQVAGVRGQSGEGAGVIGVSDRNRAGLFQTRFEHRPPEMRDHATRANEVAPQICLLAPQLDTAQVEDILPRAGIAGDLLAVLPRASRFDRQGFPAQLWFCVRTGSNDPGLSGATWAPIQLGATVVVP